MNIIVNENEVNPPGDLTTWGDVLDWIETRKLTPGQCITRVVFEDQEEIHYRKPAVCGRDVREIGSVRVESGNFDKVVRESMAELEGELKRALVSTRDIVKMLENRDEQGGYAELAQLLEAIRVFYSVFSEDLGWADVSDLGLSRSQCASSLESAIRQLIAAQESRFWVSICDVLEFEVTPVLESWQKTVERTRARIH